MLIKSSVCAVNVDCTLRASQRKKCINGCVKRKINELQPIGIHYACIESEYVCMNESKIEEKPQNYAQPRYNSGNVIIYEIYRKLLRHSDAICPKKGQALPHC